MDESLDLEYGRKSIKKTGEIDTSSKEEPEFLINTNSNLIQKSMRDEEEDQKIGGRIVINERPQMVEVSLIRTLEADVTTEYAKKSKKERKKKGCP